jgi:hypothetical protein
MGNRKTGLNWRTVKKYVDGNISVQKTGDDVRARIGEILDNWLEENTKLKKNCY